MTLLFSHLEAEQPLGLITSADGLNSPVECRKCSVTPTLALAVVVNHVFLLLLPNSEVKKMG